MIGQHPVKPLPPHDLPELRQVGKPLRRVVVLVDVRQEVGTDPPGEAEAPEAVVELAHAPQSMIALLVHDPGRYKTPRLGGPKYLVHRMPTFLPASPVARVR